MRKVLQKIAIAFAISVAALCSLIAIYIFYLAYIYPIDKTITEGSGYGFTIGQNKEAALMTAKELYKDQKVDFTNFYSRPILNKEIIFKPVKEIDIEAIRKYDIWTFRFEHDGSLHLTFDGEMIFKIHRWRHPETI